MHRPHVPQHLPALTPVGGRSRCLLPQAPRPPLRLLRPHGPHQQELHRRRRRAHPSAPGPPVTFARKQSKEDVALAYLAQAQGREGILFVGKAQEKTPVFRTERRTNPQTGKKYPWIVRSTALVNHFCSCGIDDDFGPFFLKFPTCFPCNAKLCINGHEYVKRQLTKEGIAFEADDNAILSCADPQRWQQLCDGLSGAKIDALPRKWLARAPDPFTAADHAAGSHYDVSILQAEFSLTQILDRPLSGRVFFEEVIRENLDLGRPDRVQLIFERRINGGRRAAFARAC